MVPAAGFARPALLAIEKMLLSGRRLLRSQVNQFLRWLESSAGLDASVEQAQRRFTFLKLRFNAVLTQLDIFSEAMSQRSEPETGVLLAGLDVAARDALMAPSLFLAPPVVCYLARDAGGAIRRARTRLPGGSENPVALVRLPRERMIGSGVSSSLVHECGHQAAELLEVLPSLRGSLTRHPAATPRERVVWDLWRRWISEIFADVWAIARVGVASTLGLIGLVSLPRAFVFRANADDPHPTPWIRVKLSCALGDAFYPHPQWAKLAGLWESFYPLDGLAGSRRQLLRDLEAEIPRLVEHLMTHRPPALAGRALGDVLTSSDRTPAALALLTGPAHRARGLESVPPTVAFAAIAQARMDGRMSPEEESVVTAKLLRHWAVEATLAERPASADRIQAVAHQVDRRRTWAMASLET